MINKPFFSICIPTRNRRTLLEETLKSVFNQTFNDYEIILQDNHSSDDTQKYCRLLVEKNQKVKYERNTVNIGFVGNVQTVMRRANGKYVFLLGDDDVLVPRCLEEFAKILKSKKNIGSIKSNIFAFFQPNKDNLFKIFLQTNKDILLPPKSYTKILDFYATFISGWVFQNRKPLAIGNGHQDAFIDTAFQQNTDKNFYYIAKPLVGQGVYNNLGRSFYSFASPWFELDVLMRKYLSGTELETAIREVKLNMINDCHNIKIFGGKTKLLAHFVWFFNDPIPGRDQLRLIAKTLLLLTIPNTILIFLRNVILNYMLLINRNKFKQIWNAEPI